MNAAANADHMNGPMNIPPDHIDRVLNSLICERLLGFERRLDESFNFQWRGQKRGEDGQPTWSEWDDALVDFAGDLKEATNMLRQTCQQVGIGYNLIYDPRNDKHTVVLLGIGDQGQPMPVVQIGGVSVLAQGIAVALCGYSGLDIMAQHRTLYPSHYLLS